MALRGATLVVNPLQAQAQHSGGYYKFLKLVEKRIDRFPPRYGCTHLGLPLKHGKRIRRDSRPANVVVTGVSDANGQRGQSFTV
jgi:hypothetical protein